jgi:hypothetical protein
MRKALLIFPLLVLSVGVSAQSTDFLNCPRTISGTLSFCPNDSTLLTHDAAAANSYQWYRNGVIIASATAQTYYAVAPGHYNCVVSDSCGTDSSGAGADVIQHALLVGLAVLNDSVCPASPPIMLNWAPPGNWPVGPGVSGNQFSAINAGPGMHMITYTYTDTTTGCSASDTLMMFVYPIASIAASASDNSVCSTDGTVILSGAPNGGLFSGPGVNGYSFQPPVAGVGTHVISYLYTDTNNCNFATAISIVVDACAGIEEVSGSSFGLFPNPSQGVVNVLLGPGTSVVTVYNALGERVLSATLNEGQHTLDLASQTPGVYMVRVQGEQGVSTKRVFLSK